MATSDAQVFSYLAVRKAIGWLGICFPFVLAIGGLLVFGRSLLGSMSDYFHSEMRDVFVGILFVMAFALLSYRGYDWLDNVVASLAALFAVGIALLPTWPDGAPRAQRGAVGYLHIVSAALFFLCLIYFALFLFTKSDPSRPPTPRKLRRNVIYRVCGYTMLVSLVAILLLFLLPDRLVDPLAPLRPVFWLESIAVCAFGFSWLTKGEAILKDVKAN